MSDGRSLNASLIQHKRLSVIIGDIDRDLQLILTDRHVYYSVGCRYVWENAFLLRSGKFNNLREMFLLRRRLLDVRLMLETRLD